MNKYRKTRLKELIFLAQGGDDFALNELVRRYQSKVYNILCALNPADDLSDLTQEALLKMTKSIKNLKSSKKFSAWLRQIITNVFLDSLRRKKKYDVVSMDNPINKNKNENEIIEIFDATQNPVEKSLNNELQTQITMAINKLPELFKCIVIMREIDGLSYEEIADVTGKSVGTVKSRLSRARTKLKENLLTYLREGK